MALGLMKIYQLVLVMMVKELLKMYFWLYTVSVQSFKLSIVGNHNYKSVLKSKKYLQFKASNLSAISAIAEKKLACFAPCLPGDCKGGLGSLKDGQDIVYRNEKEFVKEEDTIDTFKGLDLHGWTNV